MGLGKRERGIERQLKKHKDRQIEKLKESLVEKVKKGRERYAEKR
jgi:hypothetical protein